MKYPIRAGVVAVTHHDLRELVQGESRGSSQIHPRAAQRSVQPPSARALDCVGASACVHNGPGAGGCELFAVGADPEARPAIPGKSPRGQEATVGSQLRVHQQGHQLVGGGDGIEPVRLQMPLPAVGEVVHRDGAVGRIRQAILQQLGRCRRRLAHHVAVRVPVPGAGNRRRGCEGDQQKRCEADAARRPACRRRP